MSYKDTKIFHKDFGDGGRKARLEIERIAERKERKHNRLDTTDAAGLSNTDTSTTECNDCGYIGDEKDDFVLIPTDTEGNYKHECPVCGSIDCSPYVEEEL